VGKVHPTEWIVCSFNVGKEIEELFGSLPVEGEADLRLEYHGNKFMISIEYGRESRLFHNYLGLRAPITPTRA